MQISDTMPHSDQIEMSVFASFLVDHRTFGEYATDLTPEHFYNGRIALVFEYMKEKNTQDITILCERFPQDAGWISECLETVATAQNLCSYIDVLNDYYFRRKMMKAAMCLLGSANDMDKESVGLADSMSTELYDIRKSDKRKPEHIKEILPRVFEELQSASKGVGLNTGLIDVDETMGCMCNGELIIVAARPSMGKSSLALNVVRHNAVRNKVPTLVFTLEMSKVMTTGRVLFSEALANYSKALNANKEELRKVGITCSEIAESPIYIDDTPAISLPKIISTSKAFHKAHGIRLVIVDHIQLMGIASRGRSRNEEVSEISAGLKNLARDLDLPVLALSQLSREVERRSPPEPMLSDLRDSGAIEQDADKVLMLYRPEVYYPNNHEHAGKAYIIVAKNRNGRTGKRMTLWDGEHMQFVNVSRQDSNGAQYADDSEW